MFNRRTVRIRAMQALYAYQHRGGGSLSKGDDFGDVRDAFSQDIEAIKEAHIQFLHALLFWADLDEESEKNALRRKHRHLNDNRWIGQLRCHPTFVRLQEQYPSSWDTEVLKVWYYETIRAKPFLRIYRVHPVVPPAAEPTLIKTFFARIIFGEEAIASYAHRKFIDWDPYDEAFASYVYAFIKKVHRADPAAFDLHIKPDMQREKNFYRTLVEATFNHFDATSKVIDQAAKNWENKRIFLLDRILLQMALAEVKHMNNIPKAVAINEYVDIAKSYSTAKSYRFIHGMLDVLLPGEASPTEGIV